MYFGLLNLQNLRHIATYLEHYWEFEVHILQFLSTIQYYKTVEYQPQTPHNLRVLIAFVSIS